MVASILQRMPPVRESRKEKEKKNNIIRTPHAPHPARSSPRTLLTPHLG
jgi:hypothetical protein